VTLLANEMRRLELLRRLAREAGFRLLADRVAPQSVTLDLRDVGVEEVLAVLLGGIPYEIRYAIDPVARGHVVETVTVGALEPIRQGSGRKAASSSSRATLPQERKRLRQERTERARELQAAAVRDLDDSDPTVRAEAVEQLEPDSEGAQRLAEILGKDPDPRVRTAAAEQLAFTDSVGAVRSLLRALGDPDPDVVSAALDALAFAGDASIVGDVRPLLAHREPRVRQKAARTIGFLE
jgi:hypothetical protein